MIGQAQPEFLDLAHRPLPGQRVDGVLHGVGGQHLAVIAVDVDLLEVALELDVDGDVLQVVLFTAARDPHQADPRFAVVTGRELDCHGSAPPISGVSERAQQQRDVAVLSGVADREHHLHLRIKRRFLVGA